MSATATGATSGTTRSRASRSPAARTGCGRSTARTATSPTPRATSPPRAGRPCSATRASGRSTRRRSRWRTRSTRPRRGSWSAPAGSSRRCARRPTEGKGAVSLDGRLIDAASIRMAENLLAKLEQIEARDPLAVAPEPAPPQKPSSSGERGGSPGGLPRAAAELRAGRAGRRSGGGCSPAGACSGGRWSARRAGAAGGRALRRDRAQPADRPDADPGSILITGVERPSDMLCALWLARRSGLFVPGATSRGAVGSRSRLGLVPAFKPAALDPCRLHARHALRERRLQAAPRCARERAAGAARGGCGGCPRAARPPGALVGRGAVGLGECAGYRSEPGVVSCSPVSSRVFSPDRIIGQPP